MRAATEVPAERVPAIVFGDGVTALAVIRSLGRAGVPVYVAGAASENISCSRWYTRAPGEPIAETTDGGVVAEYLRGLAFARAVPIPASDEWALALGSLPESTTSAFPAPVAPRHVLEILIDKERFAEATRQFGIPAPRTIRVRSADDLSAVTPEELPGFFL